VEYQEYNEQLRELGTRYMNESMRAWERYTQAVSDAASGRINTDDMRQRFNRFAQDEGADFIRRMIKTNMDYYMALLDTGMGFTNRMYEAIFEQQRGVKVEEEGVTKRTSTAAGGASELHFSGPAGAKPKQAFVVANHHADAVDVSFEMTEFLSEDGMVRARIPASFDPDRFTLAAGEERIVECTLPMHVDLKPGQSYSSLVRVKGFPEMAVRLIATPVAAKKTTPGSHAKTRTSAHGKPKSRRK
jgi:hypothetical protein